MKFQLGLIGYPIKHSMSPWIYERFFQKTKLYGTYTILEGKEDTLAYQVERIKENNYRGFNITAPYKEKVIPLLDELDDTARHIGAVNTVLNQDGYLIGYNTDGIGYVRSLEHYFPTLQKNKQQSILILGAGGAARGIYFALKKNGYHTIDIANRTIEKARTIITNMGMDARTSNVLSLEKAEAHIKNYDIIIQTTSVGMKPHPNQIPISLNSLRSGVIVSDIVYQPIWTKFLKEAKARGAHVHHGHTMLLYQAQYAYEIWFGEKPILNEMDNELRRIIEG